MDQKSIVKINHLFNSMGRNIKKYVLLLPMVFAMVVLSSEILAQQINTTQLPNLQSATIQKSNVLNNDKETQSLKLIFNIDAKTADPRDIRIGLNYNNKTERGGLFRATSSAPGNYTFIETGDILISGNE
ncbi:hypothetical protein BVY03_04515 [bacterium K02(2017)]|nr:hypothetical protein BVY03_04515 [bacterium K02(2017)]